MAPDRKRLEEAISAIQKLTQEIKEDRDSIGSSSTWDEIFFAGIKPGRGLMGNEEEEREYLKNLDASEDQAKRSDSSEETDSDADNEPGDLERPKFGNQYVEVDGEHIHVNDYLGERWVARIRELHNVEPIETPPNMRVQPYHWQLKAAAQGHWSCKSEIKGFLFGDDMGIGKTLSAIMMLWLVKDEPGFSLVVAPAGLCQQWVDSIRGAWKDGHGLTVFWLRSGDSQTESMSAGSLRALSVDVVVISYELLDNFYKKIPDFVSELDKYRKIPQAERGPPPKRPDSILHSEIWRMTDMPIKRLVLDEAQTINQRGGVRHQAVKTLFYNSVVQMSSTFTHDACHDMSRCVRLLSGHPFETHSKFLATFRQQGTTDHPDLTGTRLLQRFLQRFTIARPSKVMELKALHEQDVEFELDSNPAEGIRQLTSAEL